jgi:hypothetical protein
LPAERNSDVSCIASSCFRLFEAHAEGLYFIHRKWQAKHATDLELFLPLFESECEQQGLRPGKRRGQEKDDR